MRLKSLMQTAVAVLFTAFMLAAPAKAATVFFPDQAGTSVTFTDLQEVNDSATPGYSLFAGITAYNDTLDFDAFNFRQDSLMVPPSLDGRLSFSVNALPGRMVTSVTVQEVGSYTTINEGIANFFLGGSAVGSQGGGADVASDMQTFAGAAGTISSGLWESTITFDSFPASDQVFIDIDNRLSAAGVGSDYAFIDKKLVLVSVTTAVPEPSSLAFLMGCAGVLSTRRRKRA